MPSENNKRIAKNTLLLYVRMFFTMLVGFFTSRVVLNALGAVDYGIYNVVGGIVGALAVLNGAMAATTQRWITIALGEDDVENLKKVFSVGLTAQLIIGLIIWGIIETVGIWYLYNYAVIPTERMDAAFIVFQISTLTMLLSIMNVPFIGAIIAHEKMGAFALFSIADVVMKLVICYALYVTSHDKLVVYASLLFLTLLINFFAIQFYSQRKFVEAKFRFGWNRQMYKQMCGMAFWNMSGHIAFVGYSQGVTLLINLFYGPAMNAASGVASQASNIIAQFSSNFQIALNPQITKTYAQGRYEEMHTLMYRSAKFSYFLMHLFAVPLFYEAHFLLEFWLGNVPDKSVNFLRIGLFIPMFMAVKDPLEKAALANGHLRNYQFVVYGILLLVCPVLYIVYKLHGVPESSSYVLLFTTVAATFAAAYMLRSMVYLNFREFLRNVMFPIFAWTPVCFLLPGVIYWAMPEGLYRLFLLSAISVVATSVIVLYGVLNKHERASLFAVIKLRIPKMISRC